MKILDLFIAFKGDDDCGFPEFPDFSSVKARKNYYAGFHFFRVFAGADNIGGISGRAYRDKDVSFPHEINQLLAKNFFKSDIVAQGGDFFYVV